MGCDAEAAFWGVAACAPAACAVGSFTTASSCTTVSKRWPAATMAGLPLRNSHDGPAAPMTFAIGLAAAALSKNIAEIWPPVTEVTYSRVQEIYPGGRFMKP